MTYNDGYLVINVIVLVIMAAFMCYLALARSYHVCQRDDLDILRYASGNKVKTNGITFKSPKTTKHIMSALKTRTMLYLVVPYQTPIDEVNVSINRPWLYTVIQVWQFTTFCLLVVTISIMNTLSSP